MFYNDIKIKTSRNFFIKVFANGMLFLHEQIGRSRERLLQQMLILCRGFHAATTGAFYINSWVIECINRHFLELNFYTALNLIDFIIFG